VGLRVYFKKQDRPTLRTMLPGALTFGILANLLLAPLGV